MTLALLATALLATALLTPRPTAACGCVEGSVLDAYEASPAVLVVAVEATEPDDDEWQVIAHGRILRTFRGPAPGPITLYPARPWDCGYPFAASQTYLVFAYPGTRGWEVSACRPTQPVASVEDAETILSFAASGGGDHPLDRGPFAVPGVWRLGPDVLERSATDDLATLLWPLPGVDPRRASALRSDVTLRGLGGARTLVLVDGFRLGSALLGDAPSVDLALVGLDALSSVEVEPGVRAARYGQGALGGVVRLSTAPGARDLPRDWPMRGHLDLRLATAEPRFDTVTGSDVHFEPVTMRLGIHLRGAGDLTGGPPLDAEVPTAHARMGAFVRPEVHTPVGTFSAGALLDFASSQYDTDDEARAIGSVQHGRYLVWLGWSRLGLAPHLTRLEVKLGYLGRTETWPELDDPAGPHGEGRAVRRLQLLLRADTPWTTGLSQRWSAELDVERLDVDGGYAPGDVGHLLDGSRYLAASASTGLVLTPSSATSLSLDGRVDGVTAVVPAEEADDSELRDVAGSGALELRQRLGETLTTRLTVASGARLPNLRELYVREPREDGTVVPNASLGAEQAVGVDGGVRWTFDPFALELVGHYTRLFDAIELAPTGLVDPQNRDAFGAPRPILQARNAAEARLYGLEALVSASLGDVRLVTTCAFTRGDDLGAGRPLRGVPPLNGHVAAVYSSETWGASAWVRWAAPQDRLSPGEPATDGYTVLGAEGYWRWAFWGRALVALDNLSNRGYRTHASTVPETGFNAVFAVQLQFP